LSAAKVAAGVQRLAASVSAVADDPAERVRLLVALARYRPTDSTGEGVVGNAMAATQAAVAALCRRAALVEMARAVAVCSPPSYDEAVALWDLVCGLLDEEILTACDGPDDAAGAALRGLKTAVAADLTARATNLGALQDVVTPAPLPALVHAYRLYQDLNRDDQLSAYAGVADPNALPPNFRALGFKR
jgi:prophage DNA circulation protein